MRKALFFLFTFVVFCSPAGADELSDLKSMFNDMQRQMEDMAGRIEELEQEKAAQAAEDQDNITRLQARVDDLEEAAPQQPQTGVLSKLNPEISIMGDFVYHTTDEDGGEMDNDFNFREVEIAASASVDTYARGDFYIAIEHEDGTTDVELEEGYLTLLETPVENLQARAGKFRPYFGKVNRMHTHALPWTTYPLITQNYLGEEGFSEAGVSLNYLIPNPADVYSELTFEAFNNNDTVLGGGEDGETIYLGHWKNFFDLSDDTTLEIGASHMFGENGNGNGSRTQLSGLDLTLNTELIDNRRTTSHTEALFSKREQDADDDLDSWGMFTSLEQQLTQRWWTFGRYDYSQLPDSSDTESHAYSAGLTFAQSEYAFWRVMLTHTDNNMSADSNAVWLQLDFGIGPHRPHQYR